MATNLGIKPDSKKVYLYRLYSLITDGGGIVYRRVFTDYAVRMSGSVSDHLDKYRQAIQQSFLQNVITRFQLDRLFPNRHPASAADNFDLTLLAFLVRVTCTEETADEELRQRVIDLEILKRFRNEIAHIHSTEEYDETKFGAFWQKIRSAILQLGEGIAGLEEEIDALRYRPIDPNREAELQEMIIDLRRKAECAHDLTARLERLEMHQTTRFTQLEESQRRLAINQSHTKSAVDDIHGKIDDAASKQEKNQTVLLEQLHQIARNPFLQLPNPGDFQCDSGLSFSLNASHGQSSIYFEKTHQYTQKDDRSGFKYVATYQQMLAKGTVTTLEDKDYEDLSKVIGTQWPSVAVHLGLSESQIGRIQESFQPNDVRANIHEMVRIWGDKEKEQATIDRLIKTVVDCTVLGVDESDFEAIIGRHIKSA